MNKFLRRITKITSRDHPVLPSHVGDGAVVVDSGEVGVAVAALNKRPNLMVVTHKLPPPTLVTSREPHVTVAKVVVAAPAVTQIIGANLGPGMIHKHKIREMIKKCV